MNVARSRVISMSRKEAYSKRVRSFRICSCNVQSDSQTETNLSQDLGMSIR